MLSNPVFPIIAFEIKGAARDNDIIILHRLLISLYGFFTT